jgi:excisionase family DNA binding protein|tara:strand:- start:183 stop:506 length:324 start_codon:yes stop_codon:yes gene_type:complete
VGLGEVSVVETMSIHEAAKFLHLNHETLRRLAQSGKIPAAKPGKKWVFIKADLADWLRSQYSQSRRTLLSESNSGDNLCHSINEVKRGGLTSPRQAETELGALLKLQ